MNAFFSKIEEELTNSPAPLSLQGEIQNYKWGQKGQRSFIASLLGFPIEKDKFYAELWLGAHALKSSSVCIEDKKIRLNKLISVLPHLILGKKQKKIFGRQFPFLMKILTADEPLSIQAHPDKKRAMEGYRREELKKIPIHSSHRNYKDTNPKPELMVALSDFYALNQFKTLKEIQKTFEKYSELSRFFQLDCDKRRSEKKIAQEMVRKIMTCPDSEVHRILSVLITRIKQEYPKNVFTKNDFEHWILKTDKIYSTEKKKDRGLFFFFLLNSIHLKSGEALYVEPGELHTYLEGIGIEAMANSDNVLRGGLTSKHTDLCELIKILTFKTGAPKIVKPDRRGNYRTPAKEFALSRIRLKNGDDYNRKTDGPEILLVLSGKIEIKAGQNVIEAKQGKIFLIPAILKKYKITAKTDQTLVFKCSTRNRMRDASLVARRRGGGFDER